MAALCSHTLSKLSSVTRILVSFAAVVWACHATRSLPQGARCVTGPNDGFEGDYAGLGELLHSPKLHECIKS